MYWATIIIYQYMPQYQNLSVDVVFVVVVLEEIKGNRRVYNLATLLSIVNKHVTFNSETSL